MISLNENSIISKRLNWKWYKKYFLPFEDKKQRKIKKAFIKEIKNKTYQYEEFPCYCDSNSFSNIAGVDKYGIRNNIVICKRCGLMMSNPRLTKSSYEKFYDKVYRQLYNPGEVSRVFPRENLERIYNNIIRNIPERINTVFEIGCNFGGLLKIFQENGYVVAGVDYGSENIKFGKNTLKIKSLFVGNSEKLLSYGKKADLIILKHVFEHFTDIDSELKIIRELLNDSGYIYIEVPGVVDWIKRKGSNIIRTLQLAHVYYFNLSTLTYVLEKSGFKLFKGDEQIVAFFKKNNKTLKSEIKLPKEYNNIVEQLRDLEYTYLKHKKKTTIKTIFHPENCLKYIKHFLP